MGLIAPVLLGDLYTINNLLVDTVVNITNIINKYDSTILI